MKSGPNPWLQQTYYRPQRSCEGYVFTGVCLSTGGWGCLPQCMLGYHTPRSRHPPRSRPPRADTHPPVADTPLGADILLGADTPREQKPPPGADTPPEADPPPRDTVTASDGTHPTGMHSCFRNDFACLQYWQHI